MRLLAAAVLGLLTLATPALAADAPSGKIIWSITSDVAGIGQGVQTFFFRFRSRDGKYEDSASYQPNDYIFGGSDFTTDTEKGGIKILSVPAGEWEFYSYSMTGGGGTGLVTFTPQKEFSVPITVIPGGTVYIGSYRAVWITGRGMFGRTTLTGGGFVASDQGPRDIAIAKRKDAAIGDVEMAVPDFAALGLPNFLAVPPAAEPRKSNIAFRIPTIPTLGVVAKGLSP